MSEYGGSMGSGVGTGSMAAVSPEKFATRPGEEDLDESLSWTTGVFGVLYTVTKEKTRMKWPMIVFRLSLDFVQLFLLIVDPRLGWDINPDNGVWKAFSLVGMNWVVSAMGYTVYIGLLYVMVAALVAVIAVSIWVAHSFKTSQFDYVWPITFLRWYGNIFFQVLDIASMSLLLIALDCTYLPYGDVQQGYNQEFPDVACWTGPHMINAGVAAFSLVIFVFAASVFQLAEIELNPISKNPLAIGHSATELQGFLIRVVMTFASVLLNNPKFVAIAYLVSSLVLVWLYLKWIPHLNAWVNYVRIGSYTGILYASLILMAVAFGPKENALALTLVMWVGTVPAGLLGALLAHYRTKYFSVTVLNLLMDPDPQVKPHNLFRVEDPREIEILMRCCRVWLPDDEDMPDPQAVAKAEVVIKYGLLMLPKDVYMIVLHSSLLIDVQGSYQSGYTQLQDAKKASPSLLMRFAIFSREQQHAQQSAGAGAGVGNAGNAMNLVSFVEYQKNLRLVLRVHREALFALKQFWTLLMHSDVTLQALMQAVRQIDIAIRAADVTYKMVMARHNSKVKIVKLYARFLEDVKQDPWSAARWFTESERLELAEEEAKNTNMFGELGIQPMAGLGNNIEHLTELVDMKGGILGRQDARAMFIMNAQCIIQLASPAVLPMFGWSTTEVKGKNINIIVPPPWSEHHNSFVRKYIITGNDNVIGRNIEFVALHKDRSTFAVNLCVAKISGMGEDIMFMGLLEVVPPTPLTACAWVMMGSECVVSVDRAFTDSFGFKPEDLLGQGWGAWIVDPEPLHKALASLRAQQLPSKADIFKAKPTHGLHHRSSTEFESSNARKTASMDEVKLKVMVRHRWAQPVSSTVTVHAGGVGSHPFYMMKFDLPSEPSHLMVADKAGRLVHATESVASALGTSVKMLMANNMQGALQALLPQPFAALHEPTLILPKLDQPIIPPPHSCRSGLSMLLVCQNKEGPPTVQPFQIKLSKKFEPGAGPGDALHVLHMRHNSMQQALSERRVRLLINNRGQVQSVLSGSSRVFGFNPESLVGCLISDFVSGFQVFGATATRGASLPIPPSLPNTRRRSNLAPDASYSPRVAASSPCTGATPFSPALAIQDSVPATPPPPAPAPPPPPPPPPAAAGIDDFEDEVMNGPSLLTKSLALLASRALELPGLSWRVGLMPPVTSDSAVTFTELQAHLSGQTTCARPTIMAVSVRLRTNTMDPASEANDIGPPQGVEPFDAERPAADEDAVIQRAVDAASGSFFFVVDLWRSDLVASVLELDEDGVVSHSTALPLYPPGLTFGQPSIKVIGQHIRTLLPMPANGTANYFLQPVSRQDEKQEQAKKRSNLKVARAHNKKAPGPINVYRTVHQTDMGMLDVEVQAVPRKGIGRQGGLYLIVRPANPSTGPTDMTQSLRTAGRTKAKVPMLDQEESAADYKAHQTNSSNLETLMMMALPSPIVAAPPRKQATIEDLDSPLTYGHKPRHTPPPGLRSQLAPPRQLGNTGPAADASLFGQLVAISVHWRRDMARGMVSHVEGIRGVMFDDGSDHDSPRPGKQTSHFRTEEWVLSGGTSPKKGSIAAVAPLSGGMWRAGSAPSGSDGSDRAEEVEADNDATNPQGDDDEEGDGGYSSRQQSRPMSPGDNDFRDDASKEHTTSEQDPDMQGVGVEAMQRSTDYKRGQRFKKLLRLLSSIAVQKPFEKFKLHAHIVIGCMIALSVGFFVLQFELLKQQKEGVTDLNSVGTAGRVVGRISHSMRELEILLSGRGQPTMPGLTTMADFPARLDVLRAGIARAKVLHGGVYLGFGKRRQLPNQFGLRELWDGQKQNETVYLDTKPNRTTVMALTSLWEAGNAYLKKADEVLYNSETYYKQNPGQFWEWSAIQYILTNGPNLMIPGYYTTMDGFLQLVIQQAAYINRIQLLVLIIQGVVVPSLALIYMWALAASVTRLQFRIYQVFIMVPLGLVRALATRPIKLDEDEEEDDTDVGVAIPDVPPEAPTVIKATSLAVQIKSSNNQTDEKDDVMASGSAATLKERAASMFKRMGSGLAFWRTGQAVTTGKRRLRSTYRIAINLTWPYIVCGLMNIVVNTIAYQKISTAGARIATFNIINFTAARLQRVHLYAQELCANDVPAVKEDLRKILKPRFLTLAYEYNAMLFGHDVVANDTAPRFQLAKEGVIYSGGKGADLLFFQAECLRVNKTSCMAPDDPLYEITNNGLDRLVRTWFQTITTMYTEPAGPTPSLNESRCEFLWRTKPDIQDGMEELSTLYHEYVLNVYNTASQLHTINLALSISCFVLFYFFVLKPFWTRCKSDRRRIAELLSQLPQEVSVDELVIRSLEIDKAALAAGGGNSQVGSMAMDGSMHGGGSRR